MVTFSFIYTIWYINITDTSCRLWRTQSVTVFCGAWSGSTGFTNIFILDSAHCLSTAYVVDIIIITTIAITKCLCKPNRSWSDVAFWGTWSESAWFIRSIFTIFKQAEMCYFFRLRHVTYRFYWAYVNSADLYQSPRSVAPELGLQTFYVITRYPSFTFYILYNSMSLLPFCFQNANCCFKMPVILPFSKLKVQIAT